MEEFYPYSIINLNLDKKVVADIIEYHQQFVCPDKEIDLCFVPERKNLCYKYSEDYYSIQYSTKMFDTNPIYGLYAAIHELCHVKVFEHSETFKEVVDTEMARWNIELEYARVYPYEYYYQGKLACGPHGGLPTSMFEVGENVHIHYNNFHTEGSIIKQNKMTVRVKVDTEDESLSYLLSPALLSKKQENCDGSQPEVSSSFCQTLDGKSYVR